MVSSTKQTERRRTMRAKNAGRKAKKLRARQGTPAFPITPEAQKPKSSAARSSNQKPSGA